MEETFLPAGKVRHLILTGTHTTGDGGQTTETHREEFWLTRGESHPLMRNEVTVPVTTMTWLDDNAYYEYQPENNQVRKYRDGVRYLAAVVPDPEFLTKTLQMDNARLVGDDTLDGRPVVIITVSNNGTSDPTPPSESKSSATTTTVTYWIDRQTMQVLQVSQVVTPPTSSTNPVGKTVNKVVLNELLDRSTLPPDFFEFTLPPGATLIEEDTAPSTPTP
jgi:hypothetical protein